MTYPYYITNNPWSPEQIKKDKEAKDSSTKTVSESNVTIPLLSSTPSQISQNNTGLVVERTQTEAGPKPKMGPLTKEETEIAQQRDGLAEEVPGWYVLKDDEQKQIKLKELLGKYRTPEGQMYEVQKLMKLAKTENDVKFFADSLSVMQRKNQTSVATEMLKNNNLVGSVKKASDNAIARQVKNLAPENQIPVENVVMTETSKETKMIMAGEVQNFAEENQVPGSQIIAKSGDVDVINEGASHVSEFASKNQTPAVSTYANADVSPDGKVIIGKTLINQNGKYAKENELDIHKIMSSLEISEIVEYAASNIWRFDKDNQAQAVKITIETGNEKAIDASAAQFDKYDKNVQADIKSEIQNTNYESAKIVLADAESKVEENQQTNSASKVSAESTKVDAVQELIKNKNTNMLQGSIKQLSDIDKEILLNQNSNNPAVIASIIACSSGNLYLKALDALGKLDVQTQRTIVQSINKTNPNVIGSKIGLYSSSVQNIYLENTKVSDLAYINRNMLSSIAKAKYDKLVKKG